MCQPTTHRPHAGWLWGADNGCFAARWDAGKWKAWLLGTRDPRAGCLFAVVPDVVGDPIATRRRFDDYVGTVLAARMPVAYAAQDGLRSVDVPWEQIDCLFIGGSTEWKLSEEARRLAIDANERDLWVHIGRVNSNRRFASWAGAADSCDGTFLIYGPQLNLPRLLRWLDAYDAAPQFHLPPPPSL